ncbi:hypothetical protein [Microbacterium sp.]|uniref:hypothetical protein n=1 Tax=Microbacterium sp. TaxID=51671 RepID=UPI003F9A35AE
MKTNEPVAGMAERAARGAEDLESLGAEQRSAHTATAGLNSDHTDDLEDLRPIDILRVTDYTENGVDSISEMRLRVRT